MKKTKLFVSIIGILLMLNVYCDIIPEDFHYVDKCVKITNIDEYDNLTILGYILFVGDSHKDTYKVTTTDCLTKGYKFNALQLFGVSTNYIANKDINTLDLPNDKNALKTNIEIEPWGGYYHDSIPIDRIEEYYKILGFSETSVFLFKWKEVVGYNNGNADLEKTYDFTGDLSLLNQTFTTKVNDFSEINPDITLYPNPANEYIIAEISNHYIGNVKISMLSSTGEVVLDDDTFKGPSKIITRLSTSNIKEGVYLLKFNFGDVEETQQIIIR